MAHRITVASLWTAVVSALVALLASLGFGRKTAPSAVVVAASPRPAAAAVRRPAVPVARRTWRAVMRGRALPPTIKQRIRAEAHGKSPSVRRSAPAAGAAADWPLAPVSQATEPSGPCPASASAVAPVAAGPAGSGRGRTVRAARQWLALAA
ncbi:DUF6344 domain-containing protein [Streptomyces sp. NPDC006326]|uniref:DUF6344 domain-containing protein n=1 Tax=Streptomyces sp. NPDC006326 TaxID=3156752 RepID=UPI00339EB8A2